MSLVDWAYLGANFLWVLGLSMILAGVSYHVWLSQQMHRPIATQFRTASWYLTLNTGLALVLLSITVMPRSERWFVRLAALIIAVAFVSVGVRRWIRRVGTP
jgi:4-hydroxybenzoate polyprenyltransferase